jgi:hypothetical protein
MSNAARGKFDAYGCSLQRSGWFRGTALGEPPGGGVNGRVQDEDESSKENLDLPSEFSRVEEEDQDVVDEVAPVDGKAALGAEPVFQRRQRADPT